MSENWVIYGAYGYTGELIAQEAKRRGLRPILSGRREQPLAELAGQLQMDYRAVDLADEAALTELLSDATLVLHCAGPFSATAEPMMRACMAAQCHYLDITGEISVFALAHSMNRRAKSASVMLHPGAGFDVVPTDCLAAMLKQQMPDATHLTLAFESAGGPSRGTALTSIEGLGSGGRVREKGEMKRVPLGYKSRQIDFGDGPRATVTIPWGDVFTAYHTTGIGNIEVYLSMPPSTIKRLRRMRWFRPLLATRFVQNWLKKKVRAKVKGPSAETREKAEMRLWGEVIGASGDCRELRMLTPNGYTLTVTASLGIVERVLAQGVGEHTGFQTPARLMGEEYVLSLPDVRLVEKASTGGGY